MHRWHWPATTAGDHSGVNPAVCRYIYVHIRLCVIPVPPGITYCFIFSVCGCTHMYICIMCSIYELIPLCHALRWNIMSVLDMCAQVLGHTYDTIIIPAYIYYCRSGCKYIRLISSVNRFQIGERSFRLDCHCCCSNIPPTSRIIHRYHYNIIMIVISHHHPLASGLPTRK